MTKKIEVVGAVILRDGHSLCVQRNRDAILPGLWQFPGGKKESGETPVAALKLEIRDELLADVRVGNLIKTSVHKYTFGEATLSTFYCHLLSADITLVDHKALAWLPPVELTTLDWAPADLPTVQALSKRFSTPAWLPSVVGKQS